ncbi:MAG: tRNA (guanosine(37)-N1)-methyltransferase TrmD [Christensenellaceae bacterium]|jgi:tRNA (guanine37-N1)-methyltransferase
MTFNCLSIFPEMFSSFVGESLCKRAIDNRIIEVNTVDFRDYTADKHRRVDDYPFGGGAGMLLMPQPLFDCFDDIKNKYAGKKSISVYMSPAGRPLSHELAVSLSEYEVVNILCGHYEGVDQRVIDTYIDMELSIGDYVLTGGELPAMVLMDCVMRFVPGVLSNDESTMNESFSGGLLEYPQYTRPQEFRGQAVPEVLLSGHHANIEKWQREQALVKTAKDRPDLLEKLDLTEKEQEILKQKQNDA